MNHAAHETNGTHLPVEQVARHADVHADPVCPYCGSGVPTSAGRIGHIGTRCPSCKGLLDELSIHATRGHMGDWFIRDEASPFRPGCSLATLRTMIDRGRVTPTSVVRGPDTEQFWHLAGRVPRIARLMGICHECGLHISPDSPECVSCGTQLVSMHDAITEANWHAPHAAAHEPNALAAAVAAPSRTLAAELADSTVKRQMQREVQIWARRAGLSIGIAAILFLTVIALATKDSWWSRIRGASDASSNPPAVATPTSATPPTAPATTPAEAPTTPAAATPETAQAADPASTLSAEQAAQPEEKAPPAPPRAGRDPKWDQVRALIATDSDESLQEAKVLLQQIIDTVGVARADEHAQAIAMRDWIERRLQTRELNALP